MTEKPNFADLPPEYAKLDNAQTVIVPAAYDKTSTWIKGADQGPDAIIDASANMELFDIETESEPYLKGIYTAQTIRDDSSPEIMTQNLTSVIETYLDMDKFVVTVGGEHSVSVAPIIAHCRKYPDTTILQLDAHDDLRDQYEGSNYNHACVMARAKELAPIVQAGIRSIDQTEMNAIDRNRVFFAHQIYSNNDWFQKAIDQMTQNVYITIDLDVFDTAIMPSTGTPEPGGLGWYQVLDFLRNVFEQKNVVGFDVVELCPKKDNKAPDFLAAKLIYKLLAYKYREQI